MIHKALLFDACNAGANSQTPTCGWYTESNGYIVPNSQVRDPWFSFSASFSTHLKDQKGYCCSCSLGEVIGISDEQSRANLDCSLFGSDASSAHCLRFNDLWYDVFAVGQAEVHYDITISLLRFDEGSQSYVQEDMVLSPSKTIVTSATGDIVAKLIGDFAPFQQFPVFEEKLLMVASQPQDHPRVTAGVQDWMIVDKTLVELSGLECNKIGVSFEGFRTESGACRNRVGSCLRNQLEDFYQVC